MIDAKVTHEFAKLNGEHFHPQPGELYTVAMTKVRYDNTFEATLTFTHLVLENEDSDGSASGDTSTARRDMDTSHGRDN